MCRLWTQLNTLLILLQSSLLFCRPECHGTLFKVRTKLEKCNLIASIDFRPFFFQLFFAIQMDEHETNTTWNTCQSYKYDKWTLDPLRLQTMSAISKLHSERIKMILNHCKSSRPIIMGSKNNALFIIVDHFRSNFQFRYNVRLCQLFIFFKKKSSRIAAFIRRYGQ